MIEPIEVIAPEGTIVNADHPASVAGGNVETSQRIVDMVFKALAQAIPDRIPAASQGTMNNLTIGGIDPRTGANSLTMKRLPAAWARGPALDGMSATHTHMTNSLNTPAEALEYAYPLRVREYRIRKGSGGGGRQKGGDGAIREIETLAAARMSLLSIGESARLTDYRAAKTARSAALSSFAAMEAGNSWHPKEVGTCRRAIACGSKRRAAAVLENEVAGRPDRGHPVRQRAQPASALTRRGRRWSVRAARLGGQDVRDPVLGFGNE